MAAFVIIISYIVYNEIAGDNILFLQTTLSTTNRRVLLSDLRDGAIQFVSAVWLSVGAHQRSGDTTL